MKAKQTDLRRVLLCPSLIQKVDRLARRNGLSRNAFIRFACIREMQESEHVESSMDGTSREREAAACCYQSGIRTSISKAAITTKACEEKFEDMTAFEVAQDPSAHGFRRGGAMTMVPTEAGVSLRHEARVNRAMDQGDPGRQIMSAGHKV